MRSRYGILDRLRGRPLEQSLRPYQPTLVEINRRGEELSQLTEGLLRERARRAQKAGERAGPGAAPHDLLIETFALVREISDRLLGLRPFDVQMLAGLALHRGRIVEMQTGEGKTLAAVPSVCLDAFGGRGVHVLTFNDYLAQRDAEWMGPIYEFFGLSVGFVRQGMSKPERRQAYASDVSYVTAKEAGFDYLRDCLCYDLDDLAHRSFHACVVDEADALLIDEARVPLVIAGGRDELPVDPHRLAEVARSLEPDRHFSTDDALRTVFLTDEGLNEAERILSCGDLCAPQNLTLLAALNQALHAEALVRRDVDYIVRDGRIELVDEFTGRVIEDRRWPDGLQSAIEAKEGLAIHDEGVILNSITLQHFIGLYPKVSGMTGTASDAAEEFQEFYKLKTVVIPTHRPCIRTDTPDRIFPTRDAKRRAVVDEILRVHGTGRPILVGTVSVEESERLAGLLGQRGIDGQVLNARNDFAEAETIAQAGSLGAVTISTNMAGRGVDIRLGPHSPEEQEAVKVLGGLLVMGTSRHESRRIDRQLQGRAGRQGDPGSSTYYVSLEDDLIQRYGIQEMIGKAMSTAAGFDDLASREIERAQRIIEGQNLDIRRMTFKYSEIVETQRRLLQEKRDRILRESADELTSGRWPPEKRATAVALLGETGVEELERRISLFHLDRTWSEYLSEVAQIREGLHLTSLSRNPLAGFDQTAIQAFSESLRNLERNIEETLRRIQIKRDGIDEKGLQGPSSTWTYLITDDPWGTLAERFFRGFDRVYLPPVKNTFRRLWEKLRNPGTPEEG